MASLSETRMTAEALLRKHGLAEQGWHFMFDNAKKRGGQADFTFKRISMSRHLIPMWTDQQVLATLKHEVAHALAGHAAGHGPEWRAVMRSLGAMPERCHDNAVVEPHLHAVCETHGVVAKRHRRTRGALCGRCRKPVSWVDTRLVRV